MAYAQISQYGMNDKVGNVSFPEGDSGDAGRKPYSRRLQHVIDQVIKGHHSSHEGDSMSPISGERPWSRYTIPVCILSPDYT